MTISQNISTQLPVVLAITGASGAIYAVRTLQWLLEEQQKVHLIVSPDGATVLRQELGFDKSVELETISSLLHAGDQLIHGRKCDSDATTIETLDRALAGVAAGNLQIHQHDDYFAPVASGSYRTAGMVVCPCSGTTLAAIAHSSGRNLIHRAAEVQLKERRKLILVPRETPLSIPQIDNMLRVSQAGAVVLPASPGWYHGVSGLSDLVDFVAARILDQLAIDHSRTRRWQQ